MSKLFTPLYDRILVQRDEEEQTLAGGIIIPDGSKDKPDNGTVLAVGHGRLLESGTIVPMIVKVGDRIAFHKYAGSEIKIGADKRLIMDESEVFGIYPKKAEECLDCGYPRVPTIPTWCKRHHDAQ